jgi:uncharacterized protein (TIGR00730 family)
VRPSLTGYAAKPVAGNRRSASGVISSVCVFCGSSSRVAEPYRHAAVDLGVEIARRGLRLIYGGGRVGLMGLLADAALGAGGRVIGVIPAFLRGLEVAHEGLSELRVVDGMHERKRLMFDLADGFVVLPGGFGTLDESIEIATWKQLGLHDKPIVLVDVQDYWRPMRVMIDRIVDERFAHPEHAALFSTAGSVDEALAELAHVPRAVVRGDAKWT